MTNSKPKRTTVSIDSEGAEVLARYKEAGFTDTATIKRALRLLNAVDTAIKEGRKITSVHKNTYVPGGETFLFL